MSSGSKDLVGKAAQSDRNYDAGFGAFCGVVRLSTEINQKFVGYYFQSPSYKEKIAASSSGVNINNLRREHIELLDLPFPPLSEQDRIVRKLEELLPQLDAGVAELHKAHSRLKSYRQAVLKAAVSGELTKEWRETHEHKLEPASDLLERITKERCMKWVQAQIAKMTVAGDKPIDEEWKTKYIEPRQCDTGGLKTLPSLWVWVRAEQVCDFITKGTTPSALKLFMSAEIPYIKVYNLTDRGTLDFSVKPTFIERSTHAGELARSRVFPGPH
jgi:type I restriction enzyme S subunit